MKITLFLILLINTSVSLFGNNIYISNDYINFLKLKKLPSKFLKGEVVGISVNLFNNTIEFVGNNNIEPFKEHYILNKKKEILVLNYKIKLNKNYCILIIKSNINHIDDTLTFDLVKNKNQKIQALLDSIKRIPILGIAEIFAKINDNLKINFKVAFNRNGCLYKGKVNIGTFYLHTFTNCNKNYSTLNLKIYDLKYCFIIDDLNANTFSLKNPPIFINDCDNKIVGRLRSCLN